MIRESNYELEYTRWSVGDARDVLVLEDYEVEPLVQEFHPVEPEDH